LNIELYENLGKVNGLLGANVVGTKSGFSKARHKLKSDIFADINQHFLTIYYGDGGSMTDGSYPYKSQASSLIRWKVFLVRGIDGSTVDIIDTASNRIHFGLQKNNI